MPAYLGGIIRTANGIAESVGGVSDHVHLLIGLRATHCLADVLRELKSVSSRWIRDKIGVRNFAWQEGYGGFTVSASQYETVRRYIEARRASSHPYLSRGVLGIVAASQNRIRRTLSLIPSPR